MDLDLYLSKNFNEIIENPDLFVSSNNDKKKKVVFNEFNNDINEFDVYGIDKIDLNESDDKEYMEYNHEYYDASNEYFDINCQNTTDDSDILNDHDDIDEQFEPELNEDNCENDIIDELYEKMYDSMQQTTNTFNEQAMNMFNEQATNIFNKQETNTNVKLFLNDNEIENDDGYYFINLMNIFTKYYNIKYNKNEHFFSNINDSEKDTSSQMELFFDAILEFKIVMKQMNLNNNEIMKQLYTEHEPEKISEMFEKGNEQIYMFELDELKLFSPSLIVCLNYIFEKNILNSNWNIYNLRDN